jgi:hypothetical protein
LRYTRLGVGLIAAAVPFATFADFILDHFYRRGALLNDAGYLAHMMWRGGPGLLVGKAVLGNESFFAFHVSPLFVFTGLLGEILPLSMAQSFALYVGVSHALLTVGAFWMLTGPYGMNRGWRLLVAAVLALVFGFNGEALAMVKFPHFEILIPAAFILFLIAWIENRLGLAILFFTVCLAVREDAGLQIFAVLTVLVVLDRWRGADVARQKGTIAFLLAGLCYGVAVSLIQRHEFSVTPLLTANYLGDPPFAHLTWQLVAIRFFGYFTYRAYIALPALCAIGWAVLARNPYILVGYVAFIPWTMLQMLAVNDAIGTIPYHYGYPYIVASFWPLVGIILWSRRTGTPVNLTATVAGFAVLLAASLVGVNRQANPSGSDLIPAFTSIPSFSEETAVDRAILLLHAARPELGRIAAEDGIASLAPDDYRENETFWPAAPQPVDSVLYFPDGYRGEAARQLAKAQALDHLYRIAGTPILIATNRPPARMPTLASLLVPLPLGSP